MVNPFAAARKALAHARLDRQEIAGSLGDLGTFPPLLVGMASQNGLDFPPPSSSPASSTSSRV